MPPFPSAATPICLKATIPHTAAGRSNFHDVKRKNVDEDISEVKRSYRKNDEVKEVREFIE
jgi:hypothetical protein